MAGERHPVLGEVHRLSRDRACSLCGREVPEDHIPLMLFGKGERAWLYCEDCEGPIMARAVRPITPPASPAGAD